MFEICVGEGGMSPSEYYELGVYEIEAVVRGIQRRKRSGWEQARLIAYCCLKPWSKDLAPEDILRLPWQEEQEAPEEITEEKIQELEEFSRMAERIIRERKHGREE